MDEEGRGQSRSHRLLAVDTVHQPIHKSHARRDVFIVLVIVVEALLTMIMGSLAVISESTLAKDVPRILLTVQPSSRLSACSHAVLDSVGDLARVGIYLGNLTKMVPLRDDYDVGVTLDIKMSLDARLVPVDPNKKGFVAVVIGSDDKLPSISYRYTACGNSCQMPEDIRVLEETKGPVTSFGDYIDKNLEENSLLANHFSYIKKRTVVKGIRFSALTTRLVVKLNLSTKLLEIKDCHPDSDVCVLTYRKQVHLNDNARMIYIYILHHGFKKTTSHIVPYLVSQIRAGCYVYNLK